MNLSPSRILTTRILNAEDALQVFVFFARELDVGDLVEAEDARIESHSAVYVEDRHVDCINSGNKRVRCRLSAGEQASKEQ